jgi:hypothetical protein
MAVNTGIYNNFAALAQREGRRMTLAEAMQAGVPEEEYHKIYGSPDQEQFAAAKAFYDARGERVPVKALVQMGFNPVEIPKIYGDAPIQNLGDLYGQEQMRVRRANDIAVQGTRGEKEDFGTAREINNTVLAQAPTMEAAQIAPVATVGDVRLGDAVGAQAAQIDPVTGVQRVQIGDAERINLENAFRARQERLANNLENVASGNAPSLAELQLKEQTDRNIDQSAGLIASQRGVNAGLATRLAVNQAANANQDASMRGAQLRLAEAIAARQELAGLSNQGRAQDTAVLAANQAAANEFTAKQAELDTGVNAANAQAANARAVTQAQLQQQAGQFSAEAQNARAVAQGDLSARLQLANQLAINNQNSAQAQLTQGANQSNQQSALNTNIQQGTLNQAANIANQTAVNQMESQRAQTAAGIRQTGISAGAQVGAAQASAAGTIGAANINANADILTNTMNNATTLAVQGGGLGAQYGGAVTANNAQNTQIAGSFIGAAGQAGAAAASDERGKKDISFADKDLEKFLSALEAKKYSYKDQEKEGAGQKVGVMAQDLEDSPIGNSFVRDTPDGKIVDYGQGLGAMLAGLASINKRLQEIEGKRA